MRPLLAALLAIFTTGCSPLFFAEVDEPLLCVTLISESFPAAPPGVPVDEDFQYDLGQKLSILDDKAVVERSLRLESMRITATGVDLSGVSSLRVTAEPQTGSGAAPVDVVDVELPASSGPVTVIDAVANDQVELAPYLFDGSNIAIRAHLEGALPSQPWSADVEACIHIKVKLDAIEAAR